jgi:hypothetical protein
MDDRIHSLNDALHCGSIFDIAYDGFLICIKRRKRFVVGVQAEAVLCAEVRAEDCADVPVSSGDKDKRL